MTTADATQHPEVEEIADLAEGLLSAGRAALLQAHLSDCSACAEVHSSLIDIQSMLGALPAPPPMPTDVSARIEAAIAAESFSALKTGRIRPDVSRETSDSSTVDVSRETCPSSDSDVSRETSLSSTTSQSASRTHGRDVDMSRPGSPGPGRARLGAHPSARRRRRRLAIGGVAAAALGFGSILVTSLTSSDEPSAGRSSAQSPLFSGRSLHSRVNSMLRESAPRKTNPDGSGSSPTGTASSGSPKKPDQAPETGTVGNTPLRALTPQAPSCVMAGIGRSETALAVDEGTYRGHGAYLVLLPYPADATRVAAYVVDASCVQDRTSAPGEVLLTTSYVRH